MDTADHAMISIHPEHARNIIGGKKTVELRRRFISLQPGSRLWIYATLPIGALVATATVGAVEFDEPSILWKRYKDNVAIPRKAFTEYFKGCDLGCAIGLVAIETIAPIPLGRIREIRGVNHIPQVAARITPAEARQFAKSAATGT